MWLSVIWDPREWCRLRAILSENRRSDVNTVAFHGDEHEDELEGGDRKKNFAGKIFFLRYDTVKMFADYIISQILGRKNVSFVFSSAFPDICCCLSPTDVTQIHLSPSPTLLFFIILFSLNMIILKYNTKMFIVSLPFLSSALTQLDPRGGGRLDGLLMVLSYVSAQIVHWWESLITITAWNGYSI